ncbi:MAG: TfoX/Sxy family protein [Candidatus Zixiibacteriota bacterium]
MPVSEEFREYIIERLQTVVPVHWRAMFGGLGIYSNQVHFAIASDNTLYFKVNGENRRDYEEAGMSPFRPFGGESYIMSYYEVPEDVLEDANILAVWVEKSISAALSRGKNKKAKKPRRK